jgi:hypothetical protein
LKFEHLIEINDLLNPLTATLTRAQLWRGLVRRAEQPEDFVLGLDGCRILERRDNELLRELTFGKVIIRDRVRFAAGASVQYRTEAGTGRRPAHHEHRGTAAATIVRAFSVRPSRR